MPSQLSWRRWLVPSGCRFVAVTLALALSGAAGHAASSAPAPPPGRSQAAPPAQESQWLTVTVVRVRPGMMAEFMELQKNKAIPALRKGGSGGRDAWGTAIFGDPMEIAFVSPVADFAVFDGPSPLSRALGEEGIRAYREEYSRLVESQRSYAIRTRPDLSLSPTTGEAPKLAVITSVQVAPGRLLDYEAIMRNEILPGMKQARVPGYLVSQTVFGGAANEYVTLVLAESFADIGKGSPLARVLGEEGLNKLLARMSGIVTSVDRRIIRYIPELSFSVGVASEVR